MKKPVLRIYLVIPVVLITLLVLPGAKSINSFSDARKPRTIRLFNGHDLEGWYAYLKGRGRNKDPKQVFKVIDGAICISGEEWGCITTKDEYENYHLVTEFRWGKKTYGIREGKARDSGVLLNSVGKDGAFQGTWMHSIECQVIEGGTGDLLVVGDGTGDFLVTCPVAPEKQGESYVFKPGGELVTIYKGRINWFGRDPDWQDVEGFRGRNDVEKPIGEWNRLECIVNHGEITNIVNGVVVNHAVAVRPVRGKIQIQSEGAEVYYRRVDLTPLP